MAQAEEEWTTLPSPIKGDADWRSYRAFRLKNGVTCLAVNDKESKTTGMSCLVNVGASADPRELSGLAHFCEHMCFLGSEKYPGENEYKRFLSNHGGRSNASTSMHVTNYKCEVLADYAEHAFDIFSNFFAAPLFTLSGTGREVNAIDSENSKNLTNDARRRLQILKALADPDHYFSKFSTGNAITLDTDKNLEWIREALLAFHRKHYKPPNMTVVLAGPQSLDTLQQWIVDRYSKIPNRMNDKKQQKIEIEKLIDEAAAEAPPNSLEQPPPPFHSAFTPKQQGGKWPILLTTKPLKSMRKLVLQWPIPSNDNREPDQSASNILSHLLGHEGPGGVFAILQDHGMASSLSAGPRIKAPDFTLFQVDLGLTEVGEKHWKQVVDIVFTYCRLLEEKVDSTPEELARIWGEMSALDRIFFHQTSPGGVYNYAPNLADRLLSYGAEKVLSAGSMLNESAETFPKSDIAEAVRLLTPTNCIVERCSESAWAESESESSAGDGVFGRKKELWYGVEYFISKIDDSVVVSWQGSKPMENEMNPSELSLPKPNRFIPRTLDLCPDLPDEAKQGPRLEKPIDPPSLLINDETGRLFHRLDDRYALPKSSLVLLIRNAAVQHRKESGHWEYDDETALLSSMLASVFNDAMAQETYDADLAGLNWSLSLSTSGIKLNCYGFSDRLPDLGLTLLKEFLSGDFIQETHVVATKDKFIRHLKTYFESRRADSHAVYYRDALLTSSDKGIDKSLDLAKEVDTEDLRRHFEAIITTSEFRLECLCTGNFAKQDAKTFYEEAFTMINQKAKGANPSIKSQELAFPGALERRINPGEDIELHFASRNPEEENGAIVCSFQSVVPAFKGDADSHPDCLPSTASIRLLSHMIREPLFDDLRTKQQLGYIVSAYYEMGYSSRRAEELNALGPMTTPVDMMTVAVLSRKLAPPEILKRIDDFMVTFRESLVNMPESEIRDHAKALSTKLLKPIPKLQTEASNHFSKIQSYAPEIFYRHQEERVNGRDPVSEIPWDSAKSLAATLQTLSRDDLLKTWDRLTKPSCRSRIVSCVYGKTFPLTANPWESIVITQSQSWFLGNRHVRIVDSFPDILRLRLMLQVFNTQPLVAHRSSVALWQPVWGKIALGTVAAVSFVGLATFAVRSQRRSTAPR